MLLLDYLAGVNVNCFGLKQLGSECEAATKRGRQGWGPSSTQKSTCFSILPPTLAGQAVDVFLTWTCPRLRLSVITSLVRGSSTLNVTHALGQGGETLKTIHRYTCRIYSTLHQLHAHMHTPCTQTHTIHSYPENTPQTPHKHTYTLMDTCTHTNSEHTPHTYHTITHACAHSHAYSCAHTWTITCTCMHTDIFCTAI